MNVSSYLEAFLSVYGWAVYRTMFLLFMMTGLFLYPILRSLIGLLIDFLSSGREDAYGYLKQAGVVIALTIAVFFFAMVPVVEISFSKARVQNICGLKDGTAAEVNNVKQSGNAANGGKYFSITETRVPIMPWIAMRLGQGINSIFYTSLPCVMHTADANRAALNVQTNDEALDKEFKDFMEQCHLKAVDLIKRIRRGEFDNATTNGKKNGVTSKEWLEKEILNDANAKFKAGIRKWDYRRIEKIAPEHMSEITEFIDSDFIYKYIYSTEGNPINSAPPSVQEALGKIPMTMHATTAVAGMPGQNFDNLPTCAAWWKKGEGQRKGLRERLLANLTDDAVLRVAPKTGIDACQEKMQEFDDTAIKISTGELKNKAKCLEQFRETIAKRESQKSGSIEERVGRNLFLAYQGNNGHIKDDTISTSESVTLAMTAAGAMAAGFISSKFGIDLSGGLLGTIVSFYGTIFMMKLLLKFLLPMAIMAVYMFWGIYMLIGEMRGAALVKGMVLIFSLTIIPGLWSIADHLDDKLWDAMYDSWTDGPIQMVLLDAASGIFYLAIPMIIFFLINLAGAGEHSGALADVQSRAGNLSGNIGQSTGKGTNKSFNWFVKGDRNSKGEIKSGGFVTKFGSGIKSGWNKIRGRK